MKEQCSKDLTITTIMHVVFDSLFWKYFAETNLGKNSFNHYLSKITGLWLRARDFPLTASMSMILATFTGNKTKVKHLLAFLLHPLPIAYSQ